MKDSQTQGACAGAAVGAAATMAAVPAIQGIGFTTSGIAANSVAAGLMSSAAIGAGGGVASGSTVAVLQGIGAAGTVPLGIAAATVAVPTVIGLGVGGVFFNGLHKDKLDSTSAYEQHDADETCWIVAIEKGPDNVRVLRYNNESDARKRFQKSWSIRILYSPDGKIATGGWNRWAHATIRRVMKEKYFST